MKLNDRVEATPKGKGTCICCGAEMVAKCGDQKVWHWAHKGRRKCDHWWENETQWHRDWKNKFPKEWQEVVHHAPDGEKHIADIKTPNGFVVEFQHSAISTKEKVARQGFYKNMIWVVDGRRFQNDFNRFDKGFRTADWKKWQTSEIKTGIPNKNLPKNWQFNAKPVFFDWGFVKSEYWIKDWNSHLICLLPENDALGWRQLFAIERTEFVKLVGDFNNFNISLFSQMQSEPPF